MEIPTVCFIHDAPALIMPSDTHGDEGVHCPSIERDTGIMKGNILKGHPHPLLVLYRKRFLRTLPMAILGSSYSTSQMGQTCTRRMLSNFSLSEVPRSYRSRTLEQYIDRLCLHLELPT